MLLTEQQSFAGGALPTPAPREGVVGKDSPEELDSLTSSHFKDWPNELGVS